MLHEEVNYLLGLSCMSNMYKLVMETLIFSHFDVDRSMHL
jgi:coenzyme F420-reducing hydrogenase beta subunit